MKKRKTLRATATLILCALAMAATLFAVRGLWQPGALSNTAAPAATAVPLVITADDTVPGARGNSIPVSWCRPENAAGAPLVVFCHGFTGNRQDAHFLSLGRRLAEHGIASVRLDFAGQGESEEPGTAYTLTNAAADIDACIEWMAAQQGADMQRIALVGHSMGGRIATEYLNHGRHAGNVLALALWSPANGDGLQGLEFLNIENYADVEAWREQARTDGEVCINRWGDFMLSEAMFEQMEQSHPAETLRAFAGPILLCYTPNEGNVFSEEYTVQPTIDAVGACAQGTVVDRETFAGGGHNYTAADWDLPEDEAAALNTQLDQALRDVTLPFLLAALGAA